MLSRLLRPFTYWRELYREIRIFSIFRRTAFENRKMLESEHSLRVDFLGRIYGVINIPEEVEGAAKQVQEAYVLQSITNFGKVMLKIGLADIQYPEIEKIPGAAAYLVILWPEYEALTFWRIIGNLIRTSIILGIFYVLIKLIIKNREYLTEWVAVSFDSLSSIL